MARSLPHPALPREAPRSACSSVVYRRICSALRAGLRLGTAAAAVASVRRPHPYTASSLESVATRT
eukprot:scaffold7339_cov124-Isochrysis_galbana.AAC.10